MSRTIQNFSTLLVVCGGLLSQPTFGQEITDVMMRDITNTIRTLCNSPDREGSEFSIEGQVEGGAIVKMLGIGGEVSLSQSEWEGIQDYRSDRANLRECVRHLTPIFLENFKSKKESGITSDQLGNICRASQHFEMCLDTWTARGSTASVGLSLWNNSSSDTEVCMFRRYAYAVSERGELARLHSNRFCWDSNANDVKKLSYAFEFDGPVGESFDFAVEFERPYAQFVFHNIKSTSGSSAEEPGQGKVAKQESRTAQQSSSGIIVTKDAIGKEVTLDLKAGEWAAWSELSPGVCMWTTDVDGAALWLATADRKPWRHTGGRATFSYFTFGAPNHRGANPKYRFEACE